MNGDYSFAIIGCGKIAPRHADEIVNQGAKLVAVCDVVREKADEIAARYGARAYYSIEDLLQQEARQLDLVSICTPNGRHAEHAIKSLQAGVHVLCEKPLCLTSAAAWQMIETARLCNRQLYVVKSTRYNPAVIALKKALDEGWPGKVYSFQLNCFWNRPAEYYRQSDWRGDIWLDGGTLYTQFSHYIDVLTWLFGGLKAAGGQRRNLAHQGVMDFEDTGVFSLEMENGVPGGLNYSVNSFRKNMEISLTVLAEKGSFRISGEYMNELSYELAEGGSLQMEGSTDRGPNDYGFYQGSMSNHQQVYANLIRALQDPSHPFTHALEAVKTVEMIEKIYRSSTVENG